MFGAITFEIASGRRIPSESDFRGDCGIRTGDFDLAVCRRNLRSCERCWTRARGGVRWRRRSSSHPARRALGRQQRGLPKQQNYQKTPIEFPTF
jgi:hypothetical protein